MKVKFNSIWLAWSLLLLVVFAVIGGGAWLSSQKYHADEARIAEVEPRFARLLGIKADISDLDKSADDAQALIDKYVFSSSQEVSQVGNTAQQKVREVFSAAGMDVVSSQILPAKSAKIFEKIAINVKVEGSLLGFQSAMSVLSTLTPAIWVDGFSVQVMGTPSAAAPQRLNVSLNLYVLRNL